MHLPRGFGLVSILALLVASANISAIADDRNNGQDDFDRIRTVTPIKHLVVIFQENVSFDHYFGTYPNALNLPGETPFVAKNNTPVVNSLKTPLDVNNKFAPLAGVDLINNNPNNNSAAPGNGKQNGCAASNPFRLAPSQALTNDQGHNESPKKAPTTTARWTAFPPGPAARHRRPRPRQSQGARDGLFRWQHDYGAVELCSALRTERQPLHHPVRSFVARRGQPDLGPDQWHRRDAERA